MKLPRLFIIVVVTIAAGMVGTYTGCSKKVTQVATTPVEEPEPVPTPEPVVPPPVDSSAIIASLIRDALKGIYFDFDKSDLRTDAVERLTVIGNLLLDRRGVSISIEGHCDERGSSDYNMALGEKRAVAAKNWLVYYGVAENRIQTTSYGKERLAAMGCMDDPCHQRNRRCEFTATGY